MKDTEPRLNQTLSCVAQVGTSGGIFERPVEAMAKAVSPTMNASGGCNEGFLREDAILIVTIITDEDDNDSPGDPAVWR